jgi:antitoxin component of MazEF toxin-antitoxin module
VLQKLQKVDDTFVLTVPQTLLDQHQLSAGQQVELQLFGKSTAIEVPARKPTQLADLVAGMNEQMTM